MDSEVYAAEARLEETHWWFVGRRRLFANEINRFRPNKDMRVLDVGTSTGTNLRMLRDAGFTDVTGVDSSDEAIRYCRQKGLGAVKKGDIRTLPFADASFDLVLATDIIEHIDDDYAAICELRRVVKSNGLILMTVPAFQALWGPQDNLSHHRRRYRKEPFLQLVRQAGLQPVRTYYFNFLLFPPIFVMRRLLTMFRVPICSENHINSRGLNRVLRVIFEIDCRVASTISPPFGVSVLCVAKLT